MNGSAMNRFAVIAPADLADASRCSPQPNHGAIAGGVDVVDLMKQNIASRPRWSI